MQGCGDACRLVACLALAMAVCMANVGNCHGQQRGSSDIGYRLEATKAIPYGSLREDVARRIHNVVSRPTIYRRLPACTVDCDAEMFTFLVRNPDVVTATWEQMGITELSLRRSGPYTFQSQDGMGTTCNFQLVCGSPQLHVYYGSGYYEGNLWKHRITGRSVMLLRTFPRDAAHGASSMAGTLDVFVVLDNEAVDLAAKTVSPLFVKAADENFITTAAFLGQMSRAAAHRPERMHLLASQLTGIDADVRSQFESVVDHVAARAQAETEIASVQYLQRPVR